MAASDYKIYGLGGAFTTLATLQVGVGPLDTEFAINGISRATGDTFDLGEGLMVGGEICRLVSFTEDGLVVARGCADTIPKPHEAGTVIWFYEGTIGVETQQNDHVGGETIGVKILPSTVGGVTMSIADSPPNELTFDFRFARPYAPGLVQLNGTPWFSNPTLDDDNDELVLSWAHRDRVLQADQLIDHMQPSTGPEPGTTYLVEVFNEDDLLKRSSGPLTGNDFTYTLANAISDFGLTSVNPGPVTGYMTLTTLREGYESRETYRCDFTVDATGAFPP